ncbi:HdeD family acid-resistance protein [Alsobacter sp. R-9]
MSNMVGGLRPENVTEAVTVLRDKWGWIVAIGVLLTLCGLAALGNMMLATFTVVIFAGVMMIVSGIIEVIHGFQIKSWGKFILEVLIGLLYIVAGIFTVTATPAAAVVMTLVIGAALAASGIMRIILAFQMQTGTPWIWVAISGVVTTLLGVMVLAQWPYSGLFVIGLFFGVDLVFAGAGWIGFGLALRNRT